MGVIQRLFGVRASKTTETKPTHPQKSLPQKQRSSAYLTSYTYSVSFDGEKSIGDLGPALDYHLNFAKLRVRSWQLYMESDIAKTVLQRYSIWIVKNGLKLQLEPIKEVIGDSGIELEDFTKNVEARFKAWSSSKHSTWKKEWTFNKLSAKTLINGKIGGDALIYMYLENGFVKTQLIDGSCLGADFSTKPFGSNIIKNGIEQDENGVHVSYHVKTTTGYSTINAYDKNTGIRVAFMYYGSEYRLSDNRGYPVITQSMDTISKIEKYKDASLSSAEERQKVPYAIEHEIGGTGESPLQDVGEFMGSPESDSALMTAAFESGEAISNKVMATENKTVHNLHPGSKMKAIESKNELFFKEFYETNADKICSAVNIPPNIAFSIYNDSFSASRAATKDWENTIEFERADFSEQFYSRVFAYWFHIEVLSNRIQAPGYLLAFEKGDFMVYESYLNARYTGPKFPHIDPVKEVKAERLKLGTQADHIPLTTVEAATENLMGGESTANLEQFRKELKSSEDLLDNENLD